MDWTFLWIIGGALVCILAGVIAGLGFSAVLGRRRGPDALQIHRRLFILIGGYVAPNSTVIVADERAGGEWVASRYNHRFALAYVPRGESLLRGKPLLCWSTDEAACPRCFQILDSLGTIEQGVHRAAAERVERERSAAVSIEGARSEGEEA